MSSAEMSINANSMQCSFAIISCPSQNPRTIPLVFVIPVIFSGRNKEVGPDFRVIDSYFTTFNFQESEYFG